MFYFLTISLFFDALSKFFFYSTWKFVQNKDIWQRFRYNNCISIKDSTNSTNPTKNYVKHLNIECENFPIMYSGRQKYSSSYPNLRDIWFFDNFVWKKAFLKLFFVLEKVIYFRECACCVRFANLSDLLIMLLKSDFTKGGWEIFMGWPLEKNFFSKGPPFGRSGKRGVVSKSDKLVNRTQQCLSIDNHIYVTA